MQEGKKSLECLYYIVRIKCHFSIYTKTGSQFLRFVFIIGIKAKHTLGAASKSTAVRSFKAFEFTIRVCPKYNFSSPHAPVFMLYSCYSLSIMVTVVYMCVLLTCWRGFSTSFTLESVIIKTPSTDRPPGSILDT